MLDLSTLIRGRVLSKEGNSDSQVSFSHRKDHSNNRRFVHSQIALLHPVKRQKYWSEEARLEWYYRTFPRKHHAIGMVDQKLTSASMRSLFSIILMKQALQIKKKIYSRRRTTVTALQEIHDKMLKYQ
ncbi:unnamed protein product [Rhizophagus irregularis]|nr:unnamed protein product [Rhizophagus irregularis]